MSNRTVCRILEVALIAAFVLGAYIVANHVGVTP